MDLAESADYLRGDDTLGAGNGDWVVFVKYDSLYARTIVGSAVQVLTCTGTQFTYSGTVPDPTATHVISYNHGASTAAPHFQWHNDTAKGDFTFHKWVTTACPTPETVYTCEDGCILRTPCHPSVVCISPNDEEFGNGVVYGFDTGGPDTSWQAIALTDINDPFRGGFRVESRCAVPDGAPALHANAAMLPCDTETGDCGAPSYVCFDSDEWV